MQFQLDEDFLPAALASGRIPLYRSGSFAHDQPFVICSGPAWLNFPAGASVKTAFILQERVRDCHL
jgi:hypothetical protein